MGNCHFKTDFDTENVAGNKIILLTLLALTKNSFNYMYCVGKGGFGKVWKVERKKIK
jgi:hypothetical protein